MRKTMAVLAVALAGTLNLSAQNNTLPLSGAAPSPFVAKTAAETALFNPEVRGNGLFFGDKGVVVAPDGSMMILAENQELANLIFYFNTTGQGYITATSSPNVFGAKEFKQDAQKSFFEFSGKFLLEKGAALEGVYRQKIRLLPDGKIFVEITWDTPKGKEKDILKSELLICFPEAKSSGGKILLESGNTTNEEFIVPDNDKWGYFAKSNISRIKIFPNETSRSVVIEPLEGIVCVGAVVKARRESIIAMVPNKEENKLTFLLDLRSGVEQDNTTAKQGGINFKALDDLTMPDAFSSNNFIQNPSFELGVESYYEFHGSSYRLEVDRDQHFWNVKPFDIDSREALLGNNSMRLLARKPAPKFNGDYRAVGYPLRTFPVPLSPGKHTFSFYAKGQPGEKQQVSLWLPNAAWTGNIHLPIGNRKGISGAQKVFDISPEWKRYSLTFDVPQPMPVSASLGAGSESGGSHVWLDGLQLEAGDKVTDFKPRPAEARLITAAADNFLEAGTPVNAKLEISSKAGTSGKAKVGVTDFFGEELFNQEFPFACGNNGKAEIKLPFDGKFPRGVFMVRTDLELPGGVRTYDLTRFSVMDFLKNEHRLKNMFAESYGQPESRHDFINLLERYKKVGIGAKNHVFNWDKIVWETYRKYGVEPTDAFMLSLLYGDNGNGELKLTGFALRDPAGDYAMQASDPQIIISDFNTAQKGEITDAYLEKVKNAAAAIAKAHPWINTWLPQGEFFFAKFPVSWWSKDGITENSMRNFAEFQRAFCQGVKAGNPNAKVCPDTPCNMSPESGIKDIGDVLAATNKLGGIKFDLLAAHTYRETPESPDLDSDAQALFKTLEKNGYKDTPVIWGEGMHFGPYNVPQWGVKSASWMPPSCWSFGPLSYDMGWAEKISAAWRARCWLVALKYQSSVISSMSGSGNVFGMDLKMTPYATQKISNTLGRLLGGAYFKKDVRFAPYVRTYIFEDEQKRPVAALWCHHPKLDAGTMKAPEAEANFGGALEQIFDLMECERSFAANEKGSVKFPISSFPLFFRGKPGSLDAFIKAFDTASLISGEDISPLLLSGKPSAPDTFIASAKNFISKEFDAELKIDEQRVPLKVPASGNASVALKLPVKLDAAKIVRENLPVAINSGGGVFATDVSFDGFICREAHGPITIGGDLDAWKDIPEVKLANRYIADGNTKVIDDKDFSGSFKTAWTPQGLYLRVNVADDKFAHKEFKSPGGNWSNDSLQVYIDTLCDARAKQQLGYDENDYDYTIYPEADGKSVKVYRSRTPDPQLGLATQAPKDKTIAEDIPASFRLVDNGYVYEIFFPAKYLLPTRLEKGYAIGFGLFVNDRDNLESKTPKSALTLAPSGTDCYDKPHLWPTMLLWE